MVHGSLDVDLIVAQDPALNNILVFARLGNLNQANPNHSGELPESQASLLVSVWMRGLAFTGVWL